MKRTLLAVLPSFADARAMSYGAALFLGFAGGSYIKLSHCADGDRLILENNGTRAQCS